MNTTSFKKKFNLHAHKKVARKIYLM